MWIAWVALIASAPRALAQAQSPSELLAISADNATTWVDNDTNIIQATGNVTITTDDATLSADNAVIWLSPMPNGLIGEQYAEVSLIGNAKIVHSQATRTNDSLYSTEVIRGRITLYGERAAHDSSDTDLYRQAYAMRPLPAPSNSSGNPATAPAPLPSTWLLEPTTQATSQPTSRPTTQPSPIYFTAYKTVQTIGTDGKVAYILTGNVLITQHKANKALANMPATELNQTDITDHIEMRGERAVILTELNSLRELGQSNQFKLPADMVQGAYLEGDVQIVDTPGADPSAPATKSENRLECERVYYDFSTDRAVLTDAVLHTLEPKNNIPLVMRAQVIHQLSDGEYRATNAELTTSSFLIPSYSVRTSSAYIRQVPSGNPLIGNETTYVAHDAVFNIFHVPVFYMPVVAGEMTDHGDVVRGLEIGNSKNNGFGIQTELGLAETFGGVSSDQFDSYYKADYFSERGPAFGFNAKYENGFITENTRQGWDFQGDFKSYFLPDDMGVDKLGKDRKSIDPGGPDDDPFRGDFQWEHQQFLPDDWQAQFRLGIVSDPTFLEYWDEGAFDSGLPHNAEAYLKHQKDNEAFTLLIEFQPNNVVTTADQLQNSVQTKAGDTNPEDAHPFEVEHVPEIGYYRIGDDLGTGALTFFSENKFDGLKFDVTSHPLTDYGFTNPAAHIGRKLVDPGIPSIGYTGITNDWVYRGDFREEVDYPMTVGPFKAVPYLLGRLTSYSDSPDDGALNRLYGGAGLRLTTAFWRVDDTAESDLFDIHRLRHVIEPEVNLFTSGENHDRNDVFLYDPDVDNIYVVTAAQLALRQRWQTKRGGPGKWRSVDFFTLNVELNLYNNQPGDNELPLSNFRGLFYSSVPEESIPRSSVDADALWRISDTTAVLADINENVQNNTLATASIGVAVQRDIRMQYFAGLRYIGDINSTIASLLMNYQISAKYSVLMQYSFNFSENSEEETSIMLMRHFDRFYVTAEYYYDEIEQDSGFRVGILPEGLGSSVSSGQLQNLFGGQQ